MPANTTPRFTLTGNVTSDGTATSSSAMAPTLTTSVGDYTGVSANHKLCFTAGAEGSRLAGLHFEALGTNTGSAARVYINNGATNTTATNNSLVGKVTLPVTTASNTAGELPSDFMFPGGPIDLPAGFRIYAGLGVTVAAGWVVTPILGGNF